MTRFSQILSYLLHPSLLPTLGMFAILNTDSYLRYAISTEFKYFLYSMLFVNTFLFPVLVTLVMYQRKIISSLHLKNRTERLYPFGFAIGFYAFTFYLLKQAGVPQVILSLVFGTSLSLLFLFLVTSKFKISAHMIGISGLLGGVLAIYLRFQSNYEALIVGLVLLWGLLGFARLKLKAHTPKEIYSGTLLGGLTVFLSVFFAWG